MESTAASTAQDVFCMQFRPSASFKFFKCLFGAKGLQQPFQSDQCKKYNWLHYDVSKDAAFCYLCMRGEHERKFLVSKKREMVFISTGFTYWKEATTAFDKYHTPLHREAIELLVLLPSQIQGDVGEMCDQSHKVEKKANRRMFMHIKFLARQRLPLRGHDETESNLKMPISEHLFFKIFLEVHAPRPP